MNVYAAPSAMNALKARHCWGCAMDGWAGLGARKGARAHRLPIRYLVWYSNLSLGGFSVSHTTAHKKELLLRAKRIQGQVEALVRALSEERDCSEVLQVMSAARGAMNSLMAELLEGHIRSHVLNGKQKPTSKQVAAADEVIDMVKSYLK
jgi:FrmR/RcnR family transcriptional regulator, repressor of frmRAB operon